MKTVLVFTALLFFAAHRAGSEPGPEPTPVDALSAAAITSSQLVDLDGDGLVEEVVALRGAGGVTPDTLGRAWPPETAVLGAGGLLVRALGGARPGAGAWSGFRHAEYAPFMVRFADIDGDGETEIVAGVFDRGAATATAPRGKLRQQLHLFRWRRGRLTPLWFCGRRYADFELASLGGRIRLLELAHARSVFQLQVFHWQGFGWWRDSAVDLGPGPVRLVRDGNTVLLERADGRRVEVGWDDVKNELRFVPH